VDKIVINFLFVLKHLLISLFFLGSLDCLHPSSSSLSLKMDCEQLLF
jgi:hypothetical protein